MPNETTSIRDTADDLYADYLERSSRSWKARLDVQRPYRWNLQRLALGRTLDVGCGTGRNLRSLENGSVGVDHNAKAVKMVRAAGLTAYTNDEFHSSPHASLDGYDSLLIAHVLEHMDETDGNALLSEYLPYLKASGRVVLITPQEAGFRTDHTHKRFVDFSGMRHHASRHNLTILKQYSFPFPRWIGHVFAYNEFVMVAER